MLLPVLGVALVLGIAAPIVVASSWRVPFGMLSIAIVLRATLGTAIVTFLAGAIGAGSFAALPWIPPERLGTSAAIFGGSVGATLMLASARRLRAVRGAYLLAQRLFDPVARADALAALRRLLDRARDARTDDGGRTYGSLVLIVTGPLTAVGEWEEAARRLAEIRPGSIDARHDAVRAQSLAACRIHLGDAKGTRDAIASVDRPVADAAIESWLVTIEALLDAIDGRANEALAVVGEEDAGGDPSLRASRRLVRAHAFVTLGREADAREELERVREEAGVVGLEQAMKPEGPASALARELAGED